MKAAASVTGAVYAEQVDATCRQLPIAVVVNLVNAVLTAIVLAPYVSWPLLLLWFASVTLVTIGRFVLWLRYRHTSISPENAHQWSRLGFVGSALAGLSLGDWRRPFCSRWFLSR